jgi:chaperonin cofactor prefoldin
MGQDDRLEILQVVEGQIDNIHKELAVQMQRMAQLQAQLDEVRCMLRELAANDPRN